ncbi:uncharacterized protein LOC130805564 [Amaranthus tricolor]|uniref:uncharacterized protein LOC130805564 n=1 Tax=Amaranthus tricolor TaxID=29722 RepID=UPI0025878392|nr:uncharacterized protein LOC130805564 [Amaranthus tricolor]
MQSNPGTVVQWEVQSIMDPNRVIFQRIFWAFGPSIKGFPHCRPFISIDGTHLYGKYKGTLMIAMAIDANSQVGKGWEEPYAFHRFCKRHLASNVHKKFKNIAVKNLFEKLLNRQRFGTIISI